MSGCVTASPWDCVKLAALRVVPLLDVAFPHNPNSRLGQPAESSLRRAGTRGEPEPGERPRAQT